jgi:hypothetical protein
MISNQAELEISIEQLNRMYRALALLRAEIPQGSPQFDLFAEGPWDEIERLRSEIDDYFAKPVAHSDA